MVFQSLDSEHLQRGDFCAAPPSPLFSPARAADAVFRPQDLSNIAWACAALRFYDDSLLAHLDNLAASTAARMSPLASSSLLTSFAKLGTTASRIFTDFLRV
jgi:hypothetical protein